MCVYVCVRPTTQERLLSVLHFNSSVHAENSHLVHVPLGLTTKKKKQVGKNSLTYGQGRKKSKFLFLELHVVRIHSNNKHNEKLRCFL